MQDAVVLSAIVPSLLIVWLLQSRNSGRRSSRAVWSVFLLGMLSALPLLFVGRELMAWSATFEPAAVRAFQRAFFVAALPEELLKLATLLVALRFVRIRCAMDGLVFGVAASLGFASLENVLFAAHEGWRTAAMRSLSAIPAHAFFGLVMGRFFAEGVLFRGLRAHGLGLALAVPVLVHTAYDFPLFLLGEADAVNPARRAAAVGFFVVLLLGGLSFGLALIGEAGRSRLGAPLRPVRIGERALAWGFLAVGGCLASLASWMILDLAVTATRRELALAAAQPAVAVLVLAECAALLYGLWLFRHGARKRRAHEALPRLAPVHPHASVRTFSSRRA